jgi:quinohemoprotein ethanol dehydrogenase
MAVGGVKDLRIMSPEAHAAFDRVVLEGTLLDQGMASFADLLSAPDVDAIHAYVISRANEDWGQIIAEQEYKESE